MKFEAQELIDQAVTASSNGEFADAMEHIFDAIFTAQVTQNKLIISHGLKIGSEILKTEALKCSDSRLVNIAQHFETVSEQVLTRSKLSKTPQHSFSK